MRFQRPGINAGWFAAALTLIVGAVALWQLNETLAVSRTTEHVEATIDTLEDAFSRLKDAETGQRGYILTGDSGYLAPYRRATDGLQEDVRALHRRLADVPTTRSALRPLDAMIARRLTEIDTTISLRRTRGFDASVEVIRTNAGKRSMDSVRAVIGTLTTAEHARLADARLRQHASVRLAVVIILGGTIGAFLLALAAHALVRSAASRLRHAAAQLAATNAELEVKTREAEAANRAKNDFLAVMSHELRTPLNAILGHTALVADGVGGPLTENQSTSLGRVQKAGRTLSALIDEILAYAHLGHENTSVDIRTIDLCEVTTDVIEVAEHLFEAKKLRLRFETPVGECIVRTDRSKVSHIILNLLTNAAKFTPSGEVTVSILPAETTVTVEVRDPGIGMSAETQRGIFDAFTQADPSRTRPAEGAGLGLSIAARLARMIQGQLTVESELGRGSTFRLRLPLELRSVNRLAARSTTQPQER